jgi:hypothetical protein
VGSIMRGMHTPMPVLKFCAVLPVTGITVTTVTTDNTGTSNSIGCCCSSCTHLLLTPRSSLGHGQSSLHLGFAPRPCAIAKVTGTIAPADCDMTRDAKPGTIHKISSTCLEEATVPSPPAYASPLRRSCKRRSIHLAHWAPLSPLHFAEPRFKRSLTDNSQGETPDLN